MFTAVGSLPGVDWRSKRLCKVAGDCELYMSRAVKGPERRKITVPGALPSLRSMVKGELFQVWACGVVICAFLACLQSAGSAGDPSDLALDVGSGFWDRTLAGAEPTSRPSKGFPSDCIVWEAVCNAFATGVVSG